MKRVAYETLSKRDRKLKHLAVAEWFESAWGGEEGDVIEVIASHYLEAYNLAPHDPDAAMVRGRAADVLAQAGERAASLAANAEAERYFNQASQLVGDPVREAELRDRAGTVAWRSGRTEAAVENYQRAIAVYDREGLSRASARVAGHLARLEAMRGQIDQAIERWRARFRGAGRPAIMTKTWQALRSTWGSVCSTTRGPTTRRSDICASPSTRAKRSVCTP